MKYKATVTIEFDDEDLEQLDESLDANGHYQENPMDALNGALDNLALGSGWIEQLERISE